MRRVAPLFVADVAALPAAIAQIVCDGDVLITLGAGSISNVAQELAQKRVQELVQPSKGAA